jgi:L-histidine N-alpha-methyltransferase
MTHAGTGAMVQTEAAAEAAVAREAFANDVRHGFSRRPFRMPSQYLYDDLGSSLFEAICNLPWYPITRAEKGLLQRHAPAILRKATRPLTIVELGCGTGEKLDLLLDAWDADYDHLAVTLIDISAAALQQSARLIAARGPARVTCHHALYDEGLARAATGDLSARLILFLGSNLGNFDPDEATRFLGRLRAALAPRDFLLIGLDLVKPEPVLQLAYDDPLRVTAAFNLNLLARMNRELHADFEHRVVWNAARQRVEMHLASVGRQTVTVRDAGCLVTFEPGESIWTESSHKYTRPGIEGMLLDAGLGVSEMWIDADAAFALVLARAS